MSRFFFDCFDGQRYAIDQYGEDLSTEDEAREQAVAIAQALFVEAVQIGEAKSVAVTVRAQDGANIYVAHCSLNGQRLKAASPTGHKPEQD